MGFLQTYGGVLDFTEQQVIFTHPDSNKVRAKDLPSNPGDEIINMNVARTYTTRIT